MKAEGLFYAAPRRVELREIELGDPGPGQVQVEVQVTGVCAYDLSLFQGLLPSYLAFPFLHGHEAVGVVLKVGDKVSALSPGDRVAAMGNSSRLLARVANVDASLAARVPGDPREPELWLAEPVACVVNGLEWSKLVPGDRVAVVGTGFMGLLFLQGLRRSLCADVVGIDIDERRLRLARDCGATEVVNPETPEGERRLAQMEKDPFDVVIECAGSQAALDLSYRILRPAGILNISSSHRGSGRRSVDVYEWHHKGIAVFNTSPKITPDFPRVFRRTVKLMERAVFDLRPLITHRTAPAKAQALFELATAKGEGYVKGIVEW
jgi:threonine dehydrogenase-like Zn-dependent dehydrogenase